MQQAQLAFRFSMLFILQPERQDLLGGKSPQFVLGCLGIGGIVFVKVVLLWFELQEFLFDFCNSIFSVEHIAELFGEGGDLLVQPLFFLLLHRPRLHVGVTACLVFQKAFLIIQTSQEGSEEG